MFELLFITIFLALLCAGLVLMAIDRTINELIYRRLRREEEQHENNQV